MNIDILTPKYFALNCKYIVPGMTYEHYLIDVINSSSFFYQKKRMWERFELQKDQAHGESDACSSLYSIDFKLLVDEDVMKAMAKNKPEVDYSHMAQGFIFTKTKLEAEQVPVPNKNILIELMVLSKDSLESGQANPTVRSLLKNLKKRKNLFLYYPYEFSSEQKIPLARFDSILNITMSKVMEYRVKEQPHMDTFVCIKVNEYFGIFEWKNGEFILRDAVHELLCGNYRDAKLYSVY